MILFLVVFAALVALGFGIASGVADFKTMNIPNIYSVGIITAFVFAYIIDALSGGVAFFAVWKSHLIAGVAVFGLTFMLFALGLIGAADSKLCSAYALWVGLPGLAALLFYMAVAGAVLGIATKVMNTRPLVTAPAAGSWPEKAQSGGNQVPYGIAIAFGAMIAFWQLGYFSPEKLAVLTGLPELTENSP